MRHPELELMLRGLLHELRNPLSSIMTAATLLQDTMQPDSPLTGEENRLLLDVVKKESLRLNFILTKFAEYIKLPDPQPAVFDLEAAIRTTMRDMQREGVLSKEIELDARLPGNLFVRADETQIRQVLQHLLTNAAEAMPAGGHLTLVANATTEDEVTVCIGDDGPGFTGESKSRAFQLFFSSRAHHLGLGLPMAKNILQLNGGRIWLNEPDENPATQPACPGASGACVCFALPSAS